MEEFLATIIFILAIAIFFFGHTVGNSTEHKFNKTMICKQLYTKTVNYEQCEKTNLNDIYKLIKPIDEK